MSATLSLAAALALAVPAAALEPLAEIGSSGTGAGQLDGPGGVTIDPAGRLFVAETNNKRVSEFTPQGAFTRAFGFDVVAGGSTGFEVCTAATGCKAGTPGGGAGQLALPFGVATDAAGRLFVADANNNRVSEFTPQGGFARAFGFDVVPGGSPGFEVCTAATAATGCQAGLFGGAAGQLAYPLGVTSDAAGRLFVADGANHRVSEFTPQGNFARAFGWDVVPGGGPGFEVCTAATGCQAGTMGGGAGQLDGPNGITTDAGGRLFVADANNNRVSQFTPQGGFARAFGFDVVGGGGTGFEVCTAATGCQAGISGGGAGQLASPRAVATDAAGRLFVADGNNHRVSEFTPQGNFARAFGWDVVPGGGPGFEVCTAATGCQAGTSGGGVGQLASPGAVATDCRGAIYVAEERGDRVQRFGEAGTPPPPCPSGGGGGGDGGGNQPPSNEFGFGKAKNNKQRGTAKLTVEVPGPGHIELAKTKKVKGDDERAEAAGIVKLAVRSKGKSKRKLDKRGKVKVTAEVTYMPDGGAPNTESTKVKLVKR